MKILTFDVETANMMDIGSICAVGWVLLENDRIVSKGYTLINPHIQFSKKNISIHGITAADVSGAPSFSDYWTQELRDLMSSSLVIAHSGNFDMSALEQALYNAGLPDPGIDYMDSLPVAKYYIDSESYSLNVLADLADFTFHHHNAGEDAEALAHVLLFMVKESGMDDLPSLLLRSHIASQSTLSNNFVPKKIKASSFKKHPGRCTDDVEAIGSALCGLRFCITGDFPGYEREDVERLILEQGGKATGSVSGLTDYLILGEFENPSVMTVKHSKALKLIEAGGKIKIISPQQFLDMLGK